MTKRTRETSAHTPRKQPDRENGVLEDWCSGLPDDILVNIISRLCLREAARTSVLSTRWKYLWTFITVLNFDSSMNLCKVGRMMSTVDSEEKKTNYINWVNHVLDLHRGSKIKDFKVYVQLFDIDSHTRAITNWINIAIAKRVENLDLILGIVGRGCTFPHDECISNLKSPHDLSNIKSLKSISLREVGVNRETLEFFIYNCPLLERLYVRGSEDLSGRLKIVGSSIRLKYLEIICCYSLEEIELSAPSLLSYKYHGKLIKFSIENVPLLVDVSLGGIHDIELRNLVDPFINYLHQLESLELNMDVEKMPLPFWELPNLRYLTLQVMADDGKNLLELTNMIKACPYLHKFTLKLIYKRGRMFNKRRKEIREFPKCPDHHQHLKVVEFIGFVGLPIDLELGFYLLENATMLEKMIINPRNPLLLEHYMYHEDSKKERDARRRAKRQLEDKVPQRVEFVVL